MNREELIELVNSRTKTVALDLGCGDDTFSLKKQDEKAFDLVIGIDLPEEGEDGGMWHIGGNRYALDCNAEKLPFDDRTVDYIESNSSYLVEWDDGTDAWRVLKDDGEVYFQTYFLGAKYIAQLRRLFGAKIEVSCYFEVRKPHKDDNIVDRALEGDWNYNVYGYKNDCEKGNKRCYCASEHNCKYSCGLIDCQGNYIKEE